MTDPEFIAKIKTIGTIIRPSEVLPCGSKSRGKLIPPENGRRAIFVPSFGVLEKEEVDYYVEKAQDDEDTRIKKNEITPMKENISNLTKAAREAPSGKRSQTIRNIIKESGR